MSLFHRREFESQGFKYAAASRQRREQASREHTARTLLAMGCTPEQILEMFRRARNTRG